MACLETRLTDPKQHLIKHNYNEHLNRKLDSLVCYTSSVFCGNVGSVPSDVFREINTREPVMKMRKDERR